MAYSYVRYTGNGTTTNFAFSFPYLSQDNVKVYQDGVEVNRTFLNASTVVVSPAPAIGSVIEIRRVTVTSTPPVDFVDGSTLLESDLDLITKYNLYTVQESLDIAGDALAQSSDGALDAEGRRIKNVATPTASNDAVNKTWAETAMSSQLAQASSLVTQATALVNQADAIISSFTISTSDPSGGTNGDVWFKVTV